MATNPPAFLHASWLSVFWLDPYPVVDCEPDALLLAKVTLGGLVPLAVRCQLLQERLPHRNDLKNSNLKRHLYEFHTLRPDASPSSIRWLASKLPQFGGFVACRRIEVFRIIDS